MNLADVKAAYRIDPCLDDEMSGWLIEELDRITGDATLGRGLVCMFCGEGFGYAGESPDVATLKAAVDHETDCAKNPYKAEIERLTGVNKILADGQTESQSGPWMQRSFQALATSRGFAIELERAIALIREANEYLNTNKLTNIAHGSILHQKFREILVGAV